MKVFFSDRAFASVMAETAEKITTETGGLFLGSVTGDCWYIVEAIDPGPKSVFQIAYFEYDQGYTQHLINKIANIYNARLSLIGLWHRHPGSFDQFSSTDDGTNAKYASMRPEGAISALVNIDPDFRLTVYHVAQPCCYSVTEYEVGDEWIPAQLLEYKKPERFSRLMKQRLDEAAGFSADCGQKHSGGLQEVIGQIRPYLTPVREAPGQEPPLLDMELLLADLLEDLDYLSGECGLSLRLSQTDTGICVREAGTGVHDAMLIFSGEGERRMVQLYPGSQIYAYSPSCIRSAQKSAQAEQRTAAEQRRQKDSFKNAVKKWITHRTEEG